MDAQATRFLFMYYGKMLNIKHFQGQLEMSFAEGTTDDRGCHFIFMKTKNRLRTSQVLAAINEFNELNPSENAMRLQTDFGQSAIVTMTSRKVQGSIYSKIKKDRERGSNHWSWDSARDEDNIQGESQEIKKKRKRTAEGTVEIDTAIYDEDYPDEEAQMAMIESISMQEQAQRQSMLAELEAEVEKFKTRAARSKERMQKYKDKLAAARDELDQAKSELADAQREVMELTKNGARGDVTIIAAPWDDERQRMEFKKLESETDWLRSQVSSYEERLQGLPAQVKSLKAELAASQQEVVELRGKLEDSNETKRSLESTVVGYRVEISGLEEELRLADEQKKNLKQQVVDGGLGRSPGEEEVDALKKELDQIRGKFEDLEQTYAILKRTSDRDIADLNELNGLCHDQKRKVCVVHIIIILISVSFIFLCR